MAEPRDNSGVGTALTVPNQAADAGGIEDMATPTGKRTPAFQFYPSDFLGSSKVQRMSLTERGAYITLLAHCWLDCGLPTDTKTLAAILHVKTVQFDRMWSGALHECFYEKNGKLQNARLDKERKKQADFSKRQSDRANAGWDARRNARDRNAAALQEPHAKALHSSSSSSSFSSSSSEKDTPRARGTPIIQKRRMDAEFEGPRVYVPKRLHSDFVGFRNHPGADAELSAWYTEVSDEWAFGAHKSDPVDPDMFKFWRDRYAEKWPPPSKADTRLPAWARS